jgi:hypothetical protein
MITKVCLRACQETSFLTGQSARAEMPHLTQESKVLYLEECPVFQEMKLGTNQAFSEDQKMNQPFRILYIMMKKMRMM